MIDIIAAIFGSFSKRQNSWLILIFDYGLIMQIKFEQAESQLYAALQRRHCTQARFAARAAIWLEACEYPGLVILKEGLTDDAPAFAVTRGALGIDLQHISCVHIGAEVIADIAQHGRCFLRNVRHGLFLLPGSVEHNFGIGCPVDASFALGGERTKNPYTEKLEAAKREGLNVDFAVWKNLTETV